MVKSFQSYVTETTQGSSSSMVWGSPTENHIATLNKTSMKLNEDTNLPEPPLNSDNKTLMELEMLEKISSSLLTESDDAMIQKYDTCILDDFIRVLEENELEYDIKEINELLSDVETITLKEKYKFNRPRPTQLAKKFGYSLNAENYNRSTTAKTPSYPSGHSSQSRFLSAYLSEKYPKHKNAFGKVASDISMSRIKGLMHYPTDVLAGELLGQHLYDQYNNREDINL